MKLRLKGDSIRLRLGPGEVQRLLAAGSVVERTGFGLGLASLSYSLEVSPAARAVSAGFDAGRLRVTVPAAEARAWAASAERVAIAADQDAGDGRRLSILVEKDFECLHGQDGDDAFPNPERGGATAGG